MVVEFFFGYRGEYVILDFWFRYFNFWVDNGDFFLKIYVGIGVFKLFFICYGKMFFVGVIVDVWKLVIRLYYNNFIDKVW